MTDPAQICCLSFALPSMCCRLTSVKYSSSFFEINNLLRFLKLFAFDLGLHFKQLGEGHNFGVDPFSIMCFKRHLHGAAIDVGVDQVF